MLILNKAFVNPNAIDIMSEPPASFSYKDHQSFPVVVYNEQDSIRIDEDKIKYICGRIISDEGFRTGRLGVVLADNGVINALNHEFLGHDFVTDVISFPIECFDTHLEGELVVSAEVAKERHEEFGWDDESELMLYLIHGTLHQVGYDDQTEDDAQRMHHKEVMYLRLLGINSPRVEED